MAKKKIDQNINQDKLSKRAYSLFDFTKKEKSFLIVICILISTAAIITPYTYAAMWFGFALAAYSAIANDSIQTIGTFIASNHTKKWYWLWLFMGLIFVATVTYSWFTFNGDVSYERLSASSTHLISSSSEPQMRVAIGRSLASTRMFIAFCNSHFVCFVILIDCNFSEFALSHFPRLNMMAFCFPFAVPMICVV